MSMQDLKRMRLRQEAFKLTEQANEIVQKANRIYKKLNYKTRYAVKRR